MKKIVFIFCLGLLMVNCKSKKSIVTKKSNQTSISVEKPQEVIEEDKEKDVIEVTPKVYASSTEHYIDLHKNTAQQEMKLYGIPASITLAQGILESGSGKGRLSVEANNHFGIKCHGWTGAKIYHDDDEDQECFRKYKDAKYSFRDHSLFLTERKRYEKLFQLRKDDYKGWAKGLKSAGYATDRKYPAKLISLIERYKLYEYDKAVLGKSYKSQQVSDTSDKMVYTVSKGDTLYSISRRYNITVKELQKLNGLHDTNLSIGQVLIVQP
ncbi:glucosaminidase domain-containing protein [Tamlana fucoidanivorans]|uniref:Peptidoglycan hydrolase n=1 Tax=Allotamlana fucoidanivorans TaxID=2583814 RepID=A0A5C4SGD6_9FLAO|nr:glucosaminidase domain-containing protein [Tamlana fucoidanivorans]TNJ42590.1 LysM peptidoglycan-binding domain-containing protein [Tamlana fucoidanivorans]